MPRKKSKLSIPIKTLFCSIKYDSNRSATFIIEKCGDTRKIKEVIKIGNWENIDNKVISELEKKAIDTVC